MTKQSSFESNFSKIQFYERAISTINDISAKYPRFKLAKDTSFQRFALILRFKIHRKALQVLKALHVLETDLDLS
jgi:hypothetical protein